MPGFLPFIFSLENSKSHRIILTMIKKKQMETIWILKLSRLPSTLFRISHFKGKRICKQLLNTFNHDFRLLFRLVHMHYKLFKLTGLKWLSRDKMKLKKWHLLLNSSVRQLLHIKKCKEKKVRKILTLQFLIFLQIYYPFRQYLQTHRTSIFQTIKYLSATSVPQYCVMAEMQRLLRPSGLSW